MGDKIRNNNKIKGVIIDGEECKRAQYADDFWLVLLHDTENINEALKELEIFCGFTGLKVNYDKSVILPIGNTTESNVQLHTDYNLKWSHNDPIKILGIWIHPDIQLMF